MRIVLACAVLALVACETTKPVTTSLRKEAGADCVSYCSQLSMDMSAVVIIANMTGCVCQPRNARADSSGGAAAASGGAVAAVLAAQQQQRQQQQAAAKH